MRRTLHLSRRSFFLLLCFAGLATSAFPQTGTYPSGSAPTSSSGSSSHNSTSPSILRSLGGDFSGPDPNFSHRQIVSRREDLKKRMIENAARLLMLTRDLQRDLQSREPDDTDAKRLDEIAKLARTVRDQMRQ